MEWTILMQQAIDYMEVHLLDPITYEDVARSLHMSPYNFHRTFSFLSGMTANEYIRNRRLSLAGQELLLSQEKVIDVALKYGYDTPESFAKAFTRFHGVSPKHAKEMGTRLCLFNPLVIKITMEGGKVMDYRLERTKEKKFIALVRDFKTEIINEPGNHDIPDFWGECHDKDLVEPLRQLRPEGKHDLYGLCSPTKNNEDHFSYGIGVLLDEETKMPEAGSSQNFVPDPEFLAQHGYQLWTVEPATYVVFQCMGEDGDCIDAMWQKFYREFQPQTGYESTDQTDYEIYYEKGEPGLFCDLWIPVTEK